MSVYQGAYISEIFRSGIEAVPKGQWEVSQILGLTRTQAFFSVVLPQTRKIVLPPLIGQYLSLIKDTSIVSMIGLSELMRGGQGIVDRIGKPIEIYALVAALYFIVCFPLSQWVRHHDRYEGDGRQYRGTQTTWHDTVTGLILRVDWDTVDADGDDNAGSYVATAVELP